MHTKLNIYAFINTSVIRSAFKRNFARRNKTALSPGDRKNRKIPRKWGKKINACIKCLWLRLCVPSEIHMPLIGSPGPPQRYRLNPSLIGPVHMYIIIPYYSNRVGNNCVILLSFRRCPAITNYSCGILHIALIWRVAARRTIKWLFCEIGAILSGRFCYWLGVWRISISISIKMLRALGNNSCIW